MTKKPTVAGIRTFSDAELRAELNRREKERKAAEEAARLEKERREREATARVLQVIRENKDAFLALLPEHSRSSCNDNNHENDNRGCSRCALILFLKEDWIAFEDWELELTMKYLG